MHVTERRHVTKDNAWQHACEQNHIFIHQHCWCGDRYGTHIHIDQHTAKTHTWNRGSMTWSCLVRCCRHQSCVITMMGRAHSITSLTTGCTSPCTPQWAMHARVVHSYMTWWWEWDGQWPFYTHSTSCQHNVHNHLVITIRTATTVVWTRSMKWHTHMDMKLWMDE